MLLARATRVMVQDPLGLTPDTQIGEVMVAFLGRVKYAAHQGLLSREIRSSIRDTTVHMRQTSKAVYRCQPALLFVTNHTSAHVVVMVSWDDP